MSLKDNFNQAVKEILKRDGLVGDEPPKDQKKKSELDKYLEPTPPPAANNEESLADSTDLDAEFESLLESVPEPDEPTFGRSLNPEAELNSGFESLNEPAPYSAPPPAPAPAPAPSPAPAPNLSNFEQSAPFGNDGGYSAPRNAASGFGAAPSSAQGYGSTNQFGGGTTPPRNTPPPPPPRTPTFIPRSPDTPYYETEETTIISRNTVIDGNIRSFANINIDGSVKGDVKLTKNISVTGKIIGDIECNNSTMNGASMQGNIASKGQVLIDRDSLLLGDVAAQFLDLNGKVKGNIDVGGKAEFKTDAIILGNITASTITVLDGATIQGYVNTTFLQETSGSIFPDTIAVSE